MHGQQHIKIPDDGLCKPKHIGAIVVILKVSNNLIVLKKLCVHYLDKWRIWYERDLLNIETFLTSLYDCLA